jgi:hypothetical protein
MIDAEVCMILAEVFQVGMLRAEVVYVCATTFLGKYSGFLGS